ncbi:protein of unknown function DUF814 [Indivirus ILV1]|uniref:NFACT RNA-binding domain-containing protein n=1 Tax=Indivirus ILV1 TaxID=1977633 RepID=A0A1V0SCV2_9VIRU|nr:protein of unknown function DUF814 [Indivirus ILV1]
MVIEDTTFPNNKIKIGENAKDNDSLVKSSKETDIWFHISSLSSCHVIIESSIEYPITKQMIFYCANLVKNHTKYKNINKITVNYTSIKNVSRTKILGTVTVKGKVNSVIV